MSALEDHVAALRESRDKLDAAVLIVLLPSPVPAIDICTKLGLDWRKDAAELRGSFLRLAEQGKARLIHGQGWAKEAGA